MTYRTIKEQIRKLGYLTEKDFALEYGDTLAEDVNDVLFELAATVAPVERRLVIERKSVEDETEFDIGQMLGGEFMRFAEIPVRDTETGFSVKGWQFETPQTLRLPKAAVGKFFVHYIKNPALIKSEDDLDFEPDISEAAQRLIALGVAARIYADDEPERAAAYEEKFRELKKAAAKDAGGSDAWEITTGWQ